MFKQLVKRSNQTLPSLQDIAATLRRTKGSRVQTARELGVSLRWLTEQIQTHPDLQEVIWEIEESIKDLAEQALYRKIERGHIRALEFYLSRKAKDRGYGDPQTAIQNNIVLNWIDLVKAA